MKKIVLYILKVYRNFFSLTIFTLFGPACRFSPSCSEYANEAIEKHGLFNGTKLTLKRLSKCHPFTRAINDPVPAKIS